MSVGLSKKLRVLDSQPVASSSRYKPSLYNHFVQGDGVVWGVNFRSAALLKLLPEAYTKVQKILSTDIVELTSDPAPDLVLSLIDNDFLVPEQLDEIQFLKTRNHMKRFGGKGLALVIAPTLRCNFGCQYCYVDLNAGKMSSSDQAKLIKFYDRKLEVGTSSEIIWTGGDPSLAMDVVEELSRNFNAICERKKCDQSASLITNGYLLDERMKTSLRNSNIQKIQISLDGNRDSHNAVRSLPNGRPTYDQILENVDAACDEITVLLRINVSARNREDIDDLLDDLEHRNIKDRAFIFFAHVDNINENSAPYGEMCLPPKDYAKLEAVLLRKAITRGFRISTRILERSPHYTFCGANSTNYYVVDSKANLLKCYSDLGTADENGIGRIDEKGDEIVTNPYNLIKWLGWDPFSVDECRECKVLPMCMGGCSYNIRNHGMDVESGCLKLRFSMDEIVTLFGEERTGQLRQATGCSGCATV